MFLYYFKIRGWEGGTPKEVSVKDKYSQVIKTKEHFNDILTLDARVTETSVLCY